MAGVDDVVKGGLVTAAMVGVGAVLLAPVAMPIFVSLGRPLAKSAIKSGIIVFDKSRETVAELREVFDDLVAEARAELQVVNQAGTATPGGNSGATATQAHGAAARA